MTPDELRAALDRLGYTQAAFARRVGVHRLTVLRWLGGTYKVPRWIGVIIELLEERAEK